MFLQPPKLSWYSYSLEEAKNSRDRWEILTIRIETSLMCDLKCKYCCNSSWNALKDEIKFEKILDLINQAKALNAKSIIVIWWWEPTIYPKFYELITYIHKNGLIPVVFTNTQTMNFSKAKFLYENNVSVIIKLDSLNEETQDSLVWVRWAYKNIQEWLTNLKSVWYGQDNGWWSLRFWASFVVNKQNMHEVGYIWRFCRKNNIFPNLEMMVPNGNAKGIKDLMLNKDERKNIKMNILKIDQNEFGYDRLPYTPLLWSGCFQPIYNLYISVEWIVRPCSSIHAEQANIYENTLQEITQKPFFVLARNIDKHLEGKCGDCKFSNLCVGCRWLAFSVAKNAWKSDFEAICSEDPSCFF